ncbi:MAG TPA: BadF/BadG/BcrA/BcrD ATPase family protein [Streptosporangiaceae bacterium]|nr:BadF/BadG/BcrA/BcrD ATPase family protein [Streptosporangiaceae bacterium]
MSTAGDGTRPAVLALDGGNSKTDVALVAADGSVLATVRGPGMPTADLDGSLRVISDLIGLIERQAGQPGRPAARHICACVANADLPEEEEQLARAIRAGGWSETTTVVNDTFAVLRAGLTGSTPDGPGVPWGVAVTCGAGINCVGVAEDGRVTRYLALGSISGDFGGGHSLGRAALWWAIRAEDGRGPETVLREAVPAHFGFPEVADVAVAIHQGKLTEQDTRGLAPVLLAAAASGDRVARDLVQRQADEICAMALVAMRRLGLTGLRTPVVLGGGLLTARDPLLTAAVVDGIAAEAPKAEVTIVDVPPIAGAVLLGLDEIGAGPSAEQQLRAAYSRSLALRRVRT